MGNSSPARAAGGCEALRVRDTRLTARGIGVLPSLIICLMLASGSVAAREDSLTVFLTLPMTNGFSDATQALVETKDLIRAALSVDQARPEDQTRPEDQARLRGRARQQEVRFVDRAEDADVVITVLGRGKGDVELTAALHNISADIVAPPVPIAPTERYIEMLVTTGPCRMLPLTLSEESSASCYRRIFVGVGLGELGARRSAGTPRRNSWEACADAVVRDVRAWLATNATRLRTQRAIASR